ncbi:MAG: PrsW family glutamic-type intramembrane protease [Anaerolineae bacterium]
MITLGAFSLALPSAAAATLGLPLYVLAAVLPAVGVVSYALGNTGLSRQGVASRMAYGGCVATSIAMVIELALMIALAAMAFVALSSTPDGRAAVDQALEALSSAAAVEGTQAAAEQAVMDQLTELLRQPVALVSAFALLGFLGPLVEELAKVGVVAARVPERRARAWLWGVSSGAGFGVVEALALSTMAMQAWPLSMTLRAGATMMHAATAGIAALGAYALAHERRYGAAIGGLAVAVLVHAAWNSLVLTATVAGAEASVGVSSVAVAMLGGLFTLLAIAFTRLSRSVSEPAMALDAEGESRALDIRRDEYGGPLVT